MLTQEAYTERLPFVYGICCPADWDRVSSLLEILQKNDCRLWCDQAAQPKEPPVAANEYSLESAEVILAFLSHQSVEDHSFRKSLNHSFLMGKTVTVVLLDQMALSPVMQMQIQQSEIVDYAVCRTNGACCLALLQLPSVKPCLEDGKTIHIPKSSTKKYYLKRRSNGDEILISKDKFTVGRKLTCSYVVADNESISRIHAVFYLNNGVCTVMDNHSTNKVYVNDRELEEGERFQIKSGDVLELGTETFIVDVIE